MFLTEFLSRGIKQFISHIGILLCDFESLPVDKKELWPPDGLASGWISCGCLTEGSMAE